MMMTSHDDAYNLVMGSLFANPGVTFLGEIKTFPHVNPFLETI